MGAWLLANGFDRGASGPMCITMRTLFGAPLEGVGVRHLLHLPSSRQSLSNLSASPRNFSKAYSRESNLGELR
jgi:hypothetical protein